VSNHRPYRDPAPRACSSHRARFEISELQSINHRRIVTANGAIWVTFSDEASVSAEPTASSKSPAAPPSGITAAPPVPIRWLLVRDPLGELEAQAFLATDLNARPGDILAWFVSRWQVEVTFAEVRAHLSGRTKQSFAPRRLCSVRAAG